MESTLGLRFDKFCIVAADTIDARSIVVNKHDANKFHSLSDNLLMAITGEVGDTSQFAEYVQKNIFFFKMINGYDLSPKEATYFARRQLAQRLRSQSPYQCNVIFGGWDSEKKKAQLFYMDYLATLMELPYCAQGYGGFFSLSAMDAYHRPDMTEEEGMEVLKKCIKEISKRFVVNLSSYQVKIVDENGIRDAGIIQSKDL